MVIINQVMKKMYLANGFSNYPIIKVEDLENAIATRGTNTGIIFVDIKKLSSLSSKEILGTLIHETTHGLKYGEVAEDYTVEEKTARTKEGRAEKEYKDKDVKDIEGLSEEEKKEYLASKKEYIEKISEDTRLEREYAESLENKSTDEPVENAVVAAPLVANPWGLGLITVGAAHFYAYNNIPTYKYYVDKGILKFDEGRLYLRGKLIEGFDWTIESINKLLTNGSKKAKITGFMSTDKGPKFEEGFGKDWSEIKDYAGKLEGIPLLANFGWTESMEYIENPVFKESFPSGKKQGVKIFYITKLGPQNKKVGTEWENYVEGTILKELSKQWLIDTQEYFYVPGLKTQKGVKPDYVIYNSKGERIGIADAKSGKKIPFDDQARGFLQVAKQTKSKTIIYYTPTGDTPIDRQLLDAAKEEKITIKQVGVK